MLKVDHTKNIVEVKNISFSYGSIDILKNITLEVHQGDYLGIIGPNGAGKTTLLKIMLGLMIPSKGSIKLFGEDINSFKGWSKIGYVPQQVTRFYLQFPATAEEVVLMGRYGRRGLLRPATITDTKAAHEALKEVGMFDYKNRLIGDLSGGEQQRVFIARALASEPTIIFLDEPTTGVDEVARRQFYALLRKLNTKLGLTLVLVSHEIDMVTKEVMHIACINRRLVCHTSPADFLRDSQSTNLFGEPVKIVTHHRHH